MANLRLVYMYYIWCKFYSHSFESSYLVSYTLCSEKTTHLTFGDGVS